MPRLIVADRTWEEAANISHHIALDNLEAALKVYGAIEDAFKLLAEYPGIGTLCELADDRAKGLRFWPVKKYTDYLVIYRPLSDGAEIERVMHGARDMGRVLRRP